MFILKTNNNLKRSEFFCLRENNNISTQPIFTEEKITMYRRAGMEREPVKRVPVHGEKEKERINQRTKPRHSIFLSSRF